MNPQFVTSAAEQARNAEDAVMWFSVLVRGLLVDNARMEAEALSRLRQIGIDVHYANPNPLAHSISGAAT